MGLRTRGACAVEPHRDLRDLGIHAVKCTTSDAVAFVAPLFLYASLLIWRTAYHEHVETIKSYLTALCCPALHQHSTVLNMLKIMALYNRGMGYFGSNLITHLELKRGQRWDKPAFNYTS